MDTAAYFQAIDHAYQTLTGTELEHRLQELLLQCEAEYGSEHIVYAAMLNELGGYFRGQDQYDKSEACFTQALHIFSGYRDMDLNIGTTINNLAGTHRLMGKYEQAKREFHDSLSYYSRTVGTKHILYASALNNLSLVCLDEKDTSGAERYLAQASAILSEMPQHQDEYASSLCNLANLYHFQGHSQWAQDALEQAISIYEQTVGTRTPHYHAALQTLGIVLMERGEFSQAHTILQKSAAASQALYGDNHNHTKSILATLSLCREKLKEQP